MRLSFAAEYPAIQAGSITLRGFRLVVTNAKLVDSEVEFQTGGDETGIGVGPKNLIRG